MHPPAATFGNAAELLHIEVHQLARPGHLHPTDGLARRSIELVETVEPVTNEHSVHGRVWWLGRSTLAPEASLIGGPCQQGPWALHLGVPPTRKETNVAQSVREIMSPSPMTLPAAATAIDAAGAMRDTNMGDVIAMDDGQICGIVTDRDIAVRAVAEGSNPAEVKPGDVCSRDLTTLPYRQHRGRGHAYAR